MKLKLKIMWQYRLFLLCIVIQIAVLLHIHKGRANKRLLDAWMPDEPQSSALNKSSAIHKFDKSDANETFYMRKFNINQDPQK